MGSNNPKAVKINQNEVIGNIIGHGGKVLIGPSG